MLGIPVWTHESDYDPGLATRIIAPFADKVFVSFQETEGFFRPKDRGKVVFTGNPVRSGFRSPDPILGRRHLGVDGKARILLVLGGSQGARSINRIVAEILDRLLQTWVVIHQTGEDSEHRESGASYHPVPFLGEELPHVLAAADLVVCRSGAATLAELACLGKAAILLPLSREGSRGDQLRNSAYFESREAALVLRDPTSDELHRAIDALCRDSNRRSALSREMKRLARPESASEIASLMAHRTA
jgi:UDP-N-acetylglucosamine--N-acetylmuramyl-(pentapeptide) pyrophosphoryl-undecaprenol N-acetylglucosamine transferase